MAFVVALLLAFFVFEPPWSYVAVAGGAAVEVSESAFWIWFSRRQRPKTGVQTLVGRTATVVRACRPDGQVRLDGELWAARCATGAGQGDLVRVLAVR